MKTIFKDLDGQLSQINSTLADESKSDKEALGDVKEALGWIDEVCDEEGVRDE